MNKKCCIIIPIHTIDELYFEELSIKNVINLYYNRYDIYMLYPETQNVSLFKNKYSKYDKLIFKHIPEWKEDSIFAYNDMCLNKKFYNHFSKYEFMLIAQPDSFILRDDLEYWMNAGYDYIGSPEYIYEICKCNNTKISVKDFIQCEYFLNFNGGLSLRKIKSFINAIKEIDKIKINKHIFYEDNIYSFINIYTGKQLLNIPDFESSINFGINNMFYFNDELNIKVWDNIKNDKLFGIHKFNYNHNHQHKKDIIRYIYKIIFKRAIELKDMFCNNPTKKCCIVIPVYNKIPTLFEEISIRNVIRKFKNKYDIVIIHSELLDITYYLETFKVNYLKIPKHVYDNTYESYNIMCLNPGLYDAFRDYEYMLLAQTDSFIFNDDLEYWLNLGYDYIGACLDFNKYHYDVTWQYTKNDIILDIIKNYNGYNINGGLCLRKNSTFKILSCNLPVIFDQVDGEDLIFSVLNDVLGDNVINLCPREICKKFANELDYLPDENIENLFGTHYLMQIEKLANDLNSPYTKPYSEYVRTSPGCIETLDKLKNKFARSLIKN